MATEKADETMVLENIRVKVRLEKCSTRSGGLVTAVRAIKKIGDVSFYTFPNELVPDSRHPELMQHPIVARINKGLTKVGQMRCFQITMTPDLVKIYMDTEFNFVFKDVYLEEEVGDSPPSVKSPLESSHLETLVKILSKPEESASRIKKNFVLEDFKGKSQNAVEWWRKFEKECESNKISDLKKQIQLLKLSVKETALDWFNSASLRLSEEHNLGMWKAEFLATFTDNSWSADRSAYSYRYLGGSLLEYALRKERMLLELQPDMQEKTRISLIVVGLPLQIQNKIKKKETGTIIQLFNNVREHESSAAKFYNTNKDKINPTSPQPEKKENPKNYKPCSICTSIGRPNRFHPENLCRSKKRPEINLVGEIHLEDESKNE